MQHLEVTCAVRRIYMSLGAKGLTGILLCFIRGYDVRFIVRGGLVGFYLLLFLYCFKRLWKSRWPCISVSLNLNSGEEKL